MLELQDRKRGLSTGATAKILHDLDEKNYQCDQVENTVKEMRDAGSRYRNLENKLGDGVLFVLGQDISESYWTKLLPKSGKPFTEAIQHLKSVKLPDKARKYSELRKAVIDSKLVLMTSTPQNALQQQPPYAGGVDFSLQGWDTMLPQTSYTFGEFGCEDQMDYCGPFQ